MESKPRHPALSSVFALFWGFLSSTFFFLTPEILLTGLAIHRVKSALWAALWALVGTLIGGSLLYFFATIKSQEALCLIAKIPGVDQIALNTAIDYLQIDKLAMPILAILSWTPAKIYFTASGAISYTYWKMLLITLPPLAVRYFAMVGLFSWIFEGTWHEEKRWIRFGVWGLFWFVFYLVYFALLYWLT